jgi:hypothetical protein
MPERIDGYRPYHDPSCPSRTSWAGRECTCGGLEKPAWNPGDEPRSAKVAEHDPSCTAVIPNRQETP